MADMGWLASQAQQIHDYFGSLFYVLITIFLALGVFVEYFKWPLGGVPSFPILVGRSLVAVLLFHSYSEISNALADVTDGVANHLGDLNTIHLVLTKAGEKVHQLSASWVSVRDTITMILSFVTFFLLYFSVYIAEAFLLYTWTILYVFSPILIAFFVLPVTAGATAGLFRSLVEVSFWKIVWSVLATLVWSSSLSQINQSGHDIGWITSICFNLILAGSLLLTPVIVEMLAGKGLSGLAKTVGGIAIGSSMVTPTSAVKTVKDRALQGRDLGIKTASFAKNTGQTIGRAVGVVPKPQPRKNGTRSKKAPGNSDASGSTRLASKGPKKPSSSQSEDQSS